MYVPLKLPKHKDFEQMKLWLDYSEPCEHGFIDIHVQHLLEG